MRMFSVGLSVLALLLFVATPPSLANQSKPPAGTLIKLKKLQQKQTVNIVGTQGCTFEISAESSDPSVVSVTRTEGAKKSHKVVIEAVGAGEATVTIETMEGSILSCEGFTFEFPVEVEFDAKGVIKNAKSQLKSGLSTAKDLVDTAFDLFCDDLAEIADAVLAGDLDPIEAYFEATAARADMYDDLAFELDQLYGETWVAMWGGIAFFETLHPDLVTLFPGGCGEWDDFREDLNDLEDKASSKAEKKLKMFIKVLGKALDGDDDALLVVSFFPEVLLEVDEPVVFPGSDPEAEPVEEATKPLAKTWTSAGRLSTSETSRLQIGGQADPGDGNVTVTLNGPGGFTTNIDAMVGEDCAFRTEFADLTPGSYTVVLTQGDNGPVSFGVVVP